MASKVTISPLIATVLLIAFSFALGAVVLSWGESFVEARAEFVNDPNEVTAGCNGVQLQLVNINNVPYGCFTDQSIEFILDNQGERVTGLQAKIISRETIQVLENVIDTPVLPGDTKRITIPYTGDPVLQVRLIPVVTEDTDISCSTHAVVLNSDAASC